MGGRGERSERGKGSKGERWMREERKERGASEKSWGGAIKGEGGERRVEGHKRKGTEGWVKGEQPGIVGPTAVSATCLALPSFSVRRTGDVAPGFSSGFFVRTKCRTRQKQKNLACQSPGDAQCCWLHPGWLPARCERAHMECYLFVVCLQQQPHMQGLPRT